MRRHLHHPIFKSFELVALMIGVPVMLYHYMPKGLMLLSLWLIALYCHIVYRDIEGQDQRVFWNRHLVTREAFMPIFSRFALCAMVITVGVLFRRPDLLFYLPRTNPGFWLLIMLLYPLLSVVPQEIIFRVFFFRRYNEVFPQRWAMVLASGLSFGAAHLIFHNAVAPALAAIGGIFFADTYYKHRSLLLVALEHTLYGDFIFTVGLGHYFYEGAVHHAAAVAAATH